MNKAVLSGVLGITTALLLSAAAWGEEARAPRVYGVLVGVSEYPDKQIKPRPHAEDDVKAIYQKVITEEPEWPDLLSANAKDLLQRVRTCPLNDPCMVLTPL